MARDERVMSASDLPDFLRPFYDRATEAEERLAKLEAFLNTSKDDMQIQPEELLDLLVELRQKIQNAKVEQEAEKEKAQKSLEKLIVENAKLQYRITHLVRALKESDEKFAQVCSK
eukprot:c13192_g1_i1 orf=353-700(-)